MKSEKILPQNVNGGNMMSECEPLSDSSVFGSSYEERPDSDPIIKDSISSDIYQHLNSSLYMKNAATSPKRI